MDPHSITAFTTLLTQAAAIVTTALGNVAQSQRTADSRLAGLCEELSDLPGLLEDVDDALEGAQKADLALIHDGLSRQCEAALSNYQTTVRNLGQLVDKIWESSPRGDGRKASVSSLDLSAYGEEFTTYRDKVRLLNSAFQTMLHAITLCLAVRADVSDERILCELDQLQASVDESLHAASRPIGGFRRAKGANKADSHITQNLRQLAEEAESFHGAVTALRGTAQSDDVTPHHAQHELADDVFDTSNLEAPESGSAHLAPTPLRSARTSFSSVFSSQDKTEQDAHGILGGTGPVGTTYAGPAGEEGDGDDCDDDDDELEQEYLNGLRELAATSIWKKEYSRAAEYLDDALFRDAATESTQTIRRQLQTQLALCYFLQGDWRQAELLVKDLAKVKVDDEIIIYNFLHALSLAHLGEYAFGYALEYCKLSLNGKRRLCKNNRADWTEYQETLGLFATIFDLSGDYIRAEVFKRRLPPGFEYSHPANEIEFLQAKKNLLVSILGEENASLDRQKSFRAELEGGHFEKQLIFRQELLRNSSMPMESESNLRRNLSQYQKYDMDTAKEVIAMVAQSSYDADDENPNDSLMSPPAPVLRSRISFGRLFGAKNSRSNTLEGKDNIVQSPTFDPSLTETPTAKQKWLGIAKPKLLLRKMKSDSRIPGLSVTEASPQEGSFSLINMQRVTTSAQSEAAQQFTWNNARCQSYSGSHSAPITGRFRSSSCVSDLDAPLSAIPSRAPSPFYEPEVEQAPGKTVGPSRPTFELADTSQSPLDVKGELAPDELLTPTAQDHPVSPSLAPELDFLGAAMAQSKDRTSVISISRSPSPFSPRDALPFSKCSPEEIEESLATAGAKEPTLLTRAPSARSCFGLIEMVSPIEYSPVEIASSNLPPAIEVSSSRDEIHASKSPVDVMCDSPIDASPVNESSLDDSSIHESMIDENMPADDSSVDESMAESVEEVDPRLGPILTEIAGILASLNDEGNADVKDLKANHTRLTALFPELKDLSRDQLIVDDIRGVLFTLRKRIKNSHRKVEEDSGYESTSPSAETVAVVSEDAKQDVPESKEKIEVELREGAEKCVSPEPEPVATKPESSKVPVIVTTEVAVADNEPLPVKVEPMRVDVRARSLSVESARSMTTKESATVTAAPVPMIVTTEFVRVDDGPVAAQVEPSKVNARARSLSVESARSVTPTGSTTVTATPAPMRPGSVIKPNHVMVTASPVPKDDKVQKRIMKLVSTSIDEASPAISPEVAKPPSSAPAQLEVFGDKAADPSDASDASNGKAFLLNLWNSLIEEGGESDLRITIDPPKRARTESDAESTTGGVKLTAEHLDINEYVFDESHSSNWDWDEWRSMGSNMGRPLRSLQPTDLYGA